MKIRNLAKYSVPALFLASLLLAVGCETTAGVGRDMEAAGEGIEDTAEEHQPYGDQARADDDL